MAITAEKSFLGRGWSFPPTFHYDQVEIMMVSDEEDIRQSLNILLSTTIGERFLQPEFGCNLETYLFEPVNATVETSIKLTVTQALRMYEPRIRLESVKLDTGLLHEGRLDIAVTYTIIATNTRYNFVYPFYTKEANKTT
jgi:phage baseplate assembly protein W